MQWRRSDQAWPSGRSCPTVDADLQPDGTQDQNVNENRAMDLTPILFSNSTSSFLIGSLTGLLSGAALFGFWAHRRFILWFFRLKSEVNETLEKNVPPSHEKDLRRPPETSPDSNPGSEASGSPVSKPVRDGRRAAKQRESDRKSSFATPQPFRQVENLVKTVCEKSGERESKAIEFGQRLNSVLDNMVEGVLVIDDRFHVIYANQACQDLLSVTVLQLNQRSLFEVIRNPAVETAVNNCISREETVETEFEISRGIRRTLALRVSWMPRNSTSHAMLVFSDVTNLRQLESMRRDFVANVSHELKTPLASIKAYAETLRMGGIEDAENRLSFVSTIEDQANRLHQLIIDLIQLARIEQGKSTFQITDVDIRALVEERAENFRDLAESSQLTLKIETGENEVWAKVDDEGMQTILDNLISNAIRYTPANGKVRVSCQAEQQQVIISVADTGIGIADEQKERIFERFYRVDKARSREKGGTGLGLSIVKHLAQSFGGSVSLESSIGRGSQFTVRIPLAKTTAKQAS